MTMQPITYPNRCLNHLFAYCGKGLKGSETRNPDGSVSFAGVSGGCPEDWTKCKSFITNQVANPYRPELEGKKLKIAETAPVAQEVKEKPKSRQKKTKEELSKTPPRMEL